MRRLITVAILALPLGACFDQRQALIEPRTGARAECGSALSGLNAWSQTESCTAKRVAEGWVPVGYGR